MSDDSAVSQSSALLTQDASGINAVLAHSMLGTVAAIRGAIDYAMAHEESVGGRDSVLLIAARRLDFLTLQLRDLAAGLPGSSVLIDLRAFLDKDPGETSS